MEVYEHGYHDFCLGPQGHKRADLPNGEVLLIRPWTAPKIRYSL